MAKKVKKEVVAKVKLQLPAGQATPAPPVGPTLSPYGINLMQFVKAFNDATKDKIGLIIPVVVTIYKDKTFDLEFKTPPTSVLLKKAAGIETAAHNPGKEIVAKIPRSKIIEIAKLKMPDLNTTDLEAAVRMIEGTAKSAGIQIVEG
ncbi:50S ribosomal protein L11 [Candidatus Caldipriscus sp.]|nr:50S ribosomal protein L11 [Candidatus Caldipriscus sp.]